MYQIVSHGWDELVQNQGICGYTHPNKQLSAIAYDTTPVKNHIPILTPNTKSWTFAVVDESIETVLQEKEFSTRQECLEELQTYLKENPVA